MDEENARIKKEQADAAHKQRLLDAQVEFNNILADYRDEDYVDDIDYNSKIFQTTTTRTVTPPTVLGTWTEDYDGGTTSVGFWHAISHITWNYVGNIGIVNATISASENDKHVFMIALIPLVSPLEPRRRQVMITHL
jgi:hypothetical protein